MQKLSERTIFRLMLACYSYSQISLEVVEIRVIILSEINLCR